MPQGFLRNMVTSYNSQLPQGRGKQRFEADSEDSRRIICKTG